MVEGFAIIGRRNRWSGTKGAGTDISNASPGGMSNIALRHGERFVVGNQIVVTACSTRFRWYWRNEGEQ
jgi:hypothetical protein